MANGAKNKRNANRYQPVCSDSRPRKKAFRRTKEKTHAESRVRAVQTPQVTWQNKADSSTLDTVLKDICARKEAPNSEQLHLLKTFVLRMETERCEEMAHQKLQSTDPLFDIIHGYPGTGKSRVIAWLRELMQEGPVRGLTRRIVFLARFFWRACPFPIACVLQWFGGLRAEKRRQCNGFWASGQKRVDSTMVWGPWPRKAPTVQWFGGLGAEKR